jgi:hypothetical protein
MSMISPSGELAIELPKFRRGRWRVLVRGAVVAHGRRSHRLFSAMPGLADRLRRDGLVVAADELQAIAAAWQGLADAEIVVDDGPR